MHLLRLKRSISISCLSLLTLTPTTPAFSADFSIYQTPEVQAAYKAGYYGLGRTVLNLDWSTHDAGLHQSMTNSIIGGPTGIAVGANVVPVTFSGTPSAPVWIGTVSNVLASMQSGQIINISASYLDYNTKSVINAPANIPNIIITRSAGNDSLPTLNTDLNQALYSSGYKGNLLLVGALGADGNIAPYSSKAGGAADRFVVASGISTSGSQGTSFAAPVVAGYAAIIQQKFPNSTGAQVSQAILDTAIMKPGWDAATYGRGQASLTNALAPTGRLR